MHEQVLKIVLSISVYNQHYTALNNFISWSLFIFLFSQPLFSIITCKFNSMQKKQKKNMVMRTEFDIKTR